MKLKLTPFDVDGRVRNGPPLSNEIPFCCWGACRLRGFRKPPFSGILSLLEIDEYEAEEADRVRLGLGDARPPSLDSALEGLLATSA